MVNRASAADLGQMLNSSLCMYKNKPYYIISINGYYTARVFNLLTQREELLEKVDENTFSAPTTRLGFINVKNFVVYASRIPIRRYKVGLSNENTHFQLLPEVNYKDGGALQVYLSDLQRVEIADAIMNRYPTIAEAWEKTKLGANIVAFDKQFAIDGRGYIYYKMDRVGEVLRSPTTNADIRFNPNYTYLTTLLDNNHENLSNAR